VLAALLTGSVLVILIGVEGKPGFGEAATAA
jgi:hypothetical protein